MQESAPTGGFLFDREGNPTRVNRDEPPGPALYRREGEWVSQALDSAIYGCRWHRIELEGVALPPGARVEVKTYADDLSRPEEQIRNLPDHLWSTHYAVTGRRQPAPGPEDDPRPAHEFLIQSGPGQYLWLKLKLVGDGYTTPVVGALRIYYPRQSYLDYLPAVYAADEESRSFLERFLAVFQTTWESLERDVDTFARLLDPRTVPSGAFMGYLADWLALPLEAAWDGEQQRRLLAAAPALYPRRGTPTSLREYLSIYLQNLNDLNPQELMAYPQIVEGFRERQRLMLTVEDLARLGRGAPLWSPSAVGRLQLDVFAREGEVRLVSTGDPERDLFHEFAHRFRIFIPSAWVRTAESEQMVRRALDAEKPAHTEFDLCLVEPRLRVGLQSSVGLDTILGACPVARLARRDDPDTPPSRPPRNRLGYDTVVARRPDRAPALRLTPATRVGVDTSLN